MNETENPARQRVIVEHSTSTQSTKPSVTITQSVSDLATVVEKAYNVREVRLSHYGAYKAWTGALDNELEVKFKEGKTVEELSNIFGRTKGAIKSRLERIAFAQKYKGIV